MPRGRCHDALDVTNPNDLTRERCGREEHVWLTDVWHVKTYNKKKKPREKQMKIPRDLLLFPPRS